MLEASGYMKEAFKWIERALKINQKRTDFLLKKASKLTLLHRYEGIKSNDKALIEDAHIEEA